MEKRYYSRDLRGFLQNITPLTFFIRKYIAEMSKVPTCRERQALLVLIDLVELRLGDAIYDIHNADVMNAEKRVQNERARDYLHQSGHVEQKRRKAMVDRGESPKSEHRLDRPMQDRLRVDRDDVPF